MKKILIIISLVTYYINSGDVPKPLSKTNFPVKKQLCNQADACDVPFNEFSQVRVHNATSNTNKDFISDKFFGYNFKMPNLVADQNWSLDQLLSKGFRVFKIPIHPVDGKAWVTHSLSKHDFDTQLKPKVYEYVGTIIPSPYRPSINQFVVDPILSKVEDKLWQIDTTNEPLENVLNTLKSFLDKNQNEVITLSLNVFDITDAILDPFETTGIYNYIHVQDVNKAWPTLGELINKNKRLIVFQDTDLTSKISDQTKKKYPWYKGFHNSNDFIISNNYDYKSLSDLNNEECNLPNSTTYSAAFFNRNNKPKNKMLDVSHFVTPDIHGDPDIANQANSFNNVMAHVDKCSKVTGMTPTFISLDFVDQNYEDIVKAVNQLNATRKTS